MTDKPSRSVSGEYADLRRMVFALDPTEVGLSPTLEHPRVFAAVMDVGFDEGVATLVCIADGTTSIYTSGGGGILGTGAQEDVAAAARLYVAATDGSLDQLLWTTDTGLPGPEHVILRALTYDGPLAALVSVDDLQTGLHPLSRAYAAAQLVITAVRTVDEFEDQTQD